MHLKTQVRSIFGMAIEQVIGKDIKNKICQQVCILCAINYEEVKRKTNTVLNKLKNILD